MPFVLDASVTVCWAFKDEEDPKATAALLRTRTTEAMVPALWWFEVRNVLIIAERRHRTAEADTSRFLRQLSHLNIRTDSAPDEPAVLRLARRHRISVYDAAYLELAERHAVPLATLDKALAAAARAEKVPILA